MKTTIALALILGGCNYDYAIMESPDEPSSETIIVYESTNIPNGNSQVQEEAVDTGSNVVDTVVVDAADTDTGTLPTEDTDEPTTETEEDTGSIDDTSGSLEDPPTVDSDTPVDDGVIADTDAGVEPTIDTDPVELPPDTDPPPVIPDEPEWSLLYYEDFTDEQAQGWSSYNGGCGSQGVTGTPPSWLATSDWNGARVPIPTPVGDHTRLTIEAQISTFTTNAVVRWLSNPVSWNSNDDGGISFYYVSGSGSGVYVGGHLVSIYPVEPDMPIKLEIEKDGQEYFVTVDDVEVVAGTTEGLSTLGEGLELHANGDCHKGLLNVYSVRFEAASH